MTVDALAHCVTRSSTAGPYLPPERISITCIFPLSTNERKCKHIFHASKNQNLHHLLRQPSPDLDTVYPIMCIFITLLIFPYKMICSTSLTLTTTSEHLSSCFFHVLISYLYGGETRSHLRDFAHGQKNTSMYIRHPKLLQFYKETLHQILLFNKLCL